MSRVLRRVLQVLIGNASCDASSECPQHVLSWDVSRNIIIFGMKSVPYLGLELFCFSGVRVGRVGESRGLCCWYSSEATRRVDSGECSQYVIAWSLRRNVNVFGLISVLYLQLSDYVSDDIIYAIERI